MSCHLLNKRDWDLVEQALIARILELEELMPDLPPDLKSATADLCGEYKMVLLKLAD